MLAHGTTPKEVILEFLEMAQYELKCNDWELIKYTLRVLAQLAEDARIDTITLLGEEENDPELQKRIRDRSRLENKDNED